jgi:hypothetical protein
MALSKRMLGDEPGGAELLLPWYAAGTLDARQARGVEEALARDPELARQLSVVRHEYAETIALNESLGAPSGLALQRLLAAIDAEPERRRRSSLARILALFASVSPRTLSLLVSLGALALVLQVGLIAALLIRNQPAAYQAASLSTSAPFERGLGAAPAPEALVRFTPETRIADITALLGTYRASIVGTAANGMFRLQFADQAMSREELTNLVNRLSREKSVSSAAPTP